MLSFACCIDDSIISVAWRIRSLMNSCCWRICSCEGPRDPMQPEATSRATAHAKTGSLFIEEIVRQLVERHVVASVEVVELARLEARGLRVPVRVLRRDGVFLQLVDFGMAGCARQQFLLGEAAYA